MDKVVHRGGEKVKNLLKIRGTALKMALIALTVSLIYLFLSPLSVAAGQKISVQDSLNRTVTLAHPAVRVVCLSESHAENIVALRAVSQLAGIAFTTDRDWVRKDLPRLSKNPSAAQMLELKPDLVVADDLWARTNQDVIRDLDRSRTPCAIFAVPSWTGFAAYLDALGALLGRDRESDAALSQLEKTIGRAKERASGKKQPNVFVLAGADFATCDPFSWGARIITTAGARLVTDAKAERLGETPWLVLFGPKKFAADAARVDVIITVISNTRGAAVLHKSDIMKDPRFKDAPAVKNGRVFEMKEADLMPSLTRLDSSLKSCAEMFAGK